MTLENGVAAPRQQEDFTSDLDAYTETLGVTETSTDEQPEGINSILEGAADDDTPAEAAPESPASETSEEKTDEVSSDVSTVAFVKGDSTFEIPADATVTIPINGEETEVSFEEMKKAINAENLSGRKIAELNRRENDLKSQEQEFQEGQEAMQEAVKIAMDGDPYGAMLKLVMMAKGEAGDPGVLLQNYIKQAQATTGKVSKLSPQQLKDVIDRKSTEYRKSLLDAKEADISKKQSFQTYQKELSQRIENAGITDEFYKEIEEELKEVLDVDLDSMDHKARADYVFQQVDTFYKPYQKLMDTLNGKYSQEQIDEIVSDETLLRNLVATSKAADENTVLAILKMQYGEPKKAAPKEAKQNSDDSNERDSSKSVAAAANSEPAPPSNEEPVEKGRVYLDLDDLLNDLESAAG